MRLRAWAERLLSPGYSCCLRCRRPWRHGGRIGVPWHITDYGEPSRLEENEDGTLTAHGGAGVFPLCESCWLALAPHTRMPYYEELLRRQDAALPEIPAQYRPTAEETARKKFEVRRAVWEGR